MIQNQCIYNISGRWLCGRERGGGCQSRDSGHGEARGRCPRTGGVCRPARAACDMQTEANKGQDREAGGGNRVPGGNQRP